METVKGFKDFSGEEAAKRERIKEIIVRTFKAYGFEPAETPVIEQEEFVKSDSQDEVISDIYKLQDKGSRKLALRYELTFQLKRLAKNKKTPYRRYQIGEVFRDEPVTANRIRQFVQCDADVVGSTIKEDAEILAMASDIMKELGIKATIYVNNIKMIEGVISAIFGLEDKREMKKLRYYLDMVDKKKTSEIIKEIEKSNKPKFLKDVRKKQLKNIFIPLLTTLKNYNLEELNKYFLGILKNRKQERGYEKSLFKEGYNELRELIEFSKNYGVELKFCGYLARGLSYYNGTIFEIKSNMKESICAGGSYVINNIKATGISFGLERISALSKIKAEEKRILIISIGEDKKAVEIAEKLRKKNINCLILYGKISKALEYANSYKLPYVIFVGKKELAKKKVKLRDMKSGKEKLVALNKISTLMRK